MVAEPVERIILPERFDFGFHARFSELGQKAIDSEVVNGVCLDFSEVAYLDSSALGMTIMLYKKCKNSGKTVVIENAHGTALDLLRLANIENMIPIK